MSGNKRIWLGLWVDAFRPGIKSSSECDRLIERAQFVGATELFVQVRRRGDAYFRNSIEPFTEDLEVQTDFDPLDYLIKAAHSHGIKIHAWLNIMAVWRAEDPIPQNERHLFHTHGVAKSGFENWFTCDENGESKFPSGYFLDPGHPDVPNYITELVKDLLKNYDVDGVHLDHIRYPPQNNDPEDGYGVGYNPESVRRFNEELGRVGIPDRNDESWRAWRVGRVTEVLERVRNSIKELKPRVCLSAALIAWGDAPKNMVEWESSGAKSRVFQDWVSWSKSGLIDLAIPMNYDQDSSVAQRDFFHNWITFERRECDVCRLAFGVGAFINSTCGLERQINYLLSSSKSDGTTGVVLYGYADILDQSTEKKTSWKELKRILLTIG